MTTKEQEKQDQKKGQQAVETLTNSYLMIDPNKSNGVLPRIYNYTDYNAFSRPTEDIDVSTGSITQSTTALPNPIAGKFIHLPDGSVSVPGLAWASDVTSGRYKIGASNFGESVAGVAVYDWNATRIFFSSSYAIRLSSDAVAMPGTTAPTTELISGKLLTNTVLSWNLRNTSTGTGAAASVGVINDTGNDLSMIMIGSGNTSLTAGEAQLSLNKGNGFANTSVGLNIVNWYTNYIRFCIGNATTEKARFDGSSGAFLINTTSRAATEILRANGAFYCDSTIRGTDITATSGSNTFLQSVTTGKFTLTTATPPSVNQFEINAGATAKSGILLYDVDNTQIHFDLNWSSGGGWIARNASVAWIRKNSARLSFFGSTGNTLNAVATETQMGYFDLSTGALNLTYSDATTNPRAILTQSSTGDSALRFAIGTTSSFIIGQDNSATGDPFKIAYAASGSAALGTNDRFTIESDGEVTVAQWFQVGTATDSATQGDLVAGLTGAARLFYDQSAATEFHYNSSGTIVNQLSAVASTATVWNEQGADIDFRIEGDTAANLFFLDASADFIGVNTSSPARRFEVFDGSSYQIRLTQTAGSKYVDLQADSSGGFICNPSGPYAGWSTSVSAGNWEFYTGNDSGTAGSSAKVTVYTNGTTGDSWFVATDFTTYWSMGLDQSDSSKFKISQNSTLGTNDRFVVETGGTVWFGTHTGSADAPVNGYITIKDAAGNTRKLATIA